MAKHRTGDKDSTQASGHRQRKSRTGLVGTALPATGATAEQGAAVGPGADWQTLPTLQTGRPVPGTGSCCAPDPAMLSLCRH